jgi:solute carrier family 25 protein 16
MYQDDVQTLAVGAERLHSSSEEDEESSSSLGLFTNENLGDDFSSDDGVNNMDYIVRSGIAGGVAGCAAKTIIAPLDRVKILFQTSNPSFRKYAGTWLGFYRAGKHIYHTHGLLGLFQGHSATLLRIFPYAAIKFVAYEQFRALLIERADQETPLRRLLAGSLSGVVSVFFTYPLDLIRVRLAFDTQGGSSHRRPIGLLHIVKTIATESTGGVGGEKDAVSLRKFYRGFVPTVVGILPY